MSEVLMALRDRIARALLPSRQEQGVAEVAQEVGELRELVHQVRNDSAIQNRRTGLGGVLDKGSSFDVGPTERLKHRKLDELYEFDGLVRRIVDIVPDDALRPGVHLQGEGEGDAALRAWLDDFGILPKLSAGMKQARLHGGALLWPVVDGVDDVRLREPRREGEQGAVVALHVIEGEDASPARWSRDIGSKHFRTPDLWHVHAEGRTYTVHASRMVWVRGLALPFKRMQERDRWPDGSLVQACWDAVARFTTVAQAGTVLAHSMQSSTLRVGGLRNMDAMAAGAALRERLKEMILSRNMLGTVLLGDGDEFQAKAHSPTGFKELSSEARSVLSAVTSIPETRLFGAAPSGLNSDGESGRDNFDRVLVDEQAAAGRYLRELMGFFDLGLPEAGWSLGWGPLSVPSFTQQAEAYAKVAAADALYVDRAVLTAEEIRGARFGEVGWQLEVPLEAEEDLAEKAKELVEAAGPVEEGVAVPEPQAEEEPEKRPLNGAQIESVLSVLERAAAGGLSREQVVVILRDMLQIDEAAVAAVVADLSQVKPMSEPEA